MTFFQEPPRLGNQFTGDRVLRSLLARVLPPEVRAEVTPSLEAMGALSAGRLLELQQADRLHEPVLTQWDPWGRRIDRIELTPLWQEAQKIAATEGLVATAYERRHGAFSRLHQFALVHLFHPSSDIYTCPLAMTDGAAKTLLAHGNRALIDRALPRLVARDPARMWTSGQWMTERTGGSDVGLSETVARQGDGAWRLYGTKWFTSAATSEMALTLARPEGSGPGGRGLALFYVETRGADGGLNGIALHRLKEKLGTRKLPTAELTLEGTVAEPVAGLADGVRNIAPMLNITRTWNAVSAVAEMRRAVALALDYGRRRVAFGAPLADKPLHRETVAALQAEYEAAFHLAFFAVELLGREEAGTLGGDAALLRLVTPLAKLCTGKQAVAVASETLEVFGGAGYIEDTGLPRLLRDSQVLPIWEGTTNVLSLDVLRVIQGGEALPALLALASDLCGAVRDARLAAPARSALEALDRAATWLEVGVDIEAGARHFALTLARSLALALLVRHAQWSIDMEGDHAAAAAARQFARAGVDRLAAIDPGDARLLTAD